jgi:hypothetical protein
MINRWRRQGILPTVVVDQSCLHDLVDVRRIMQAPRLKRGVDHAWVLAQLRKLDRDIQE